ncbi:MAG TPA: hypothetical protein VFW07_01375 [Parafilimonas sp.]|nr:hypothetical protein [Parafilimonas sp.]
MENLIGTILHFREADYKTTISSYDKVAPYISDIKAIYESFGIGQLTHPVLNDLLKYNTGKYKEQYITTSIDAIKKAGIINNAINNAVAKECDAEMEKLHRSIKKYHAALKALVTSSVYPIYIDVNKFALNGKVILQMETAEKMKDDFSIKIVNTSQAEIYSQFL